MLTRTDPLTTLVDSVLRTAPLGRFDTGLAMDAVWHGDELVLTLDVPGVAENAIELTVKNRMLTVTAERKDERGEGDRVVLRERPFGRWSRTVKLGPSLDADRVQARYGEGVLTIVIPSSPQAAERKISIARGEGNGSIDTTASEPGVLESEPTELN